MLQLNDPWHAYMYHAVLTLQDADPALPRTAAFLYVPFTNILPRATLKKKPKEVQRESLRIASALVEFGFLCQVGPCGCVGVSATRALLFGTRYSWFFFFG